MSYEYESYAKPKPRRRGRCLIIAVVALIWVVLGGVALLRYVVRPYLTTTLLEGAQQGVLPNPNDFPAPNIPADALPAGPVTIPISEADANQWMQEHRAELQGLDNVVVHFVPSQITADLTARGVTSTATASVAVVDGRLVAVNPQLGAPLNLFVDIQPFAKLLEQRLNQDLASLNRRVSSVTVEQGQMTIILE